MNKIIFTLFAFLFFISTSVFSQQEQDNDPTTWKYFTIYVNEQDDPLFSKLGRDLFLSLDEIDEVDYELRYSSDYFKIGCEYKLLVDIRDPNSYNQYLVLGDYNTKDIRKSLNANRYAWSQLSIEVQNGLIAWKSSNKRKGNDTLKNALKEESEIILDPKTWKYFKILVRTSDDSIFIKFQDDLRIRPRLESYSLVVNISDPSSINQYVVLGDEIDPNSFRYNWSELSSKVQNGLLNWTGTNKINSLVNLEDIRLLNCAIDLYGHSRNIYYIYYKRGIAYSLLDKTDEAFADLNKSIELNPAFSKSFYERGKLNVHVNKFNDAINDFTKSIQLNAISPVFYENRGLAYYYSNKYTEAISDFKKAILLRPSQENLYRYFINEAKNKIK